ncbi:MAG: NAD(P)-binding domain-containing protein [Actinobacteria bacterium]|nr:NAD(P)-binding domain-containing protein [Actinomycetota bacterium]
MSTRELPVVVIGGGPVGLAATAHLAARKIESRLFEAGPAVGAAVSRWGHVQLFTPWKDNVDPEARQLLRRSGWRQLPDEAYPTGRELVESYLRPLAELPLLRDRLQTNARVLSVSRLGADRLRDTGREDAPFELIVVTSAGTDRVLSRAVIDASGTYGSPNPLGASGVSALGEHALAPRISYGIPDVLGKEKSRFGDRRVLVAGSGHSAQQVVRDLVRLRAELPRTQVTWAVRGPSPDRLFGVDGADPLPARALLGNAAREIIEAGEAQLALNSGILELREDRRGVIAKTASGELPGVDELVAATGFRPDLSFLSELRIALDPVLQSAERLAPLIDPKHHWCGSVPRHGADELAQSHEPGYYAIGMKSYGRAPTFLLRTGYAQIASVLAALTGESTARREGVDLGLAPTDCACTVPDEAHRVEAPVPDLLAASPSCAQPPTHCG